MTSRHTCLVVKLSCEGTNSFRCQSGLIGRWPVFSVQSSDVWIESSIRLRKSRSRLCYGYAGTFLQGSCTFFLVPEPHQRLLQTLTDEVPLETFPLFFVLFMYLDTGF